MDDVRWAHLDAIAAHSRGLVAAADGHLDARVEHCPGWDVADLVWHLSEVQWFWATIVDERLAAPPDESRRPVRPGGDQLLEGLRAASERLIDVLAVADPAATVWTWAPSAHHAGFVLRHQVQEAAVHHWDAVHAAGGSLELDGPVAADAVDEFLTYSVSSDADPADPARPALAGTFALRATDTGDAWTLSDGRSPGTVGFVAGDVADDVPVLVAPAGELLLWLYGRVPAPSGVPADLLARFRALCFTE